MVMAVEHIESLLEEGNTRAQNYSNQNSNFQQDRTKLAAFFLVPQIGHVSQYSARLSVVVSNG